MFLLVPSASETLWVGVVIDTHEISELGLDKNTQEQMQKKKRVAMWSKM